MEVASMMKEFVEIAAHAAEIAGVGVIIGGMVFAAARYAFVRAGGALERYKRCRHDLGRAILLGLEILVAADIISTVTLTPTLESVLVLGIIVLIRTFLSWSLALELDGRWPWQRGPERALS
jgi:uncharacterized membrane protein